MLSTMVQKWFFNINERIVHRFIVSNQSLRLDFIYECNIELSFEASVR
mgnify:CR=1 FL=1